MSGGAKGPGELTGITKLKPSHTFSYHRRDW